MRIGDSRSASYRKVASHRAIKKRHAIARLCHRLDKMVERAERFGKYTMMRARLMTQANIIREKLRAIDH